MDRLLAKLDSLLAIGKALDAFDGNEGGPEAAHMDMKDKTELSDTYKAARLMAALTYDKIEQAAGGDIDQYARLLVWDEIMPAAKESTEPVVWITGNSYMPPIRALDRIDEFWQRTANHGHILHDMADTLWCHLVEAIEDECEKQQIHMASPEWDNALYVVDERRWEYVENTDGESLNDDWVPIVRHD